MCVLMGKYGRASTLSEDREGLSHNSDHMFCTTEEFLKGNISVFVFWGNNCCALNNISIHAELGIGFLGAKLCLVAKRV